MVGAALAREVSVTVLLAVFGSKADVTAVARLVSGPEALGRTTMGTSTRLPPANVLRLQVTIPPLCEHVPCPGTAETNVTPAGSTLVRKIPVATEGPRLVTVTV